MKLKSNGSQTSSKRPTVKIIVVLCTLFLLAFSVLFLFSPGFAAFISGGNFKGVAIAGDYYFASDCLQIILNEDEDELNTVQCSLLSNEFSIGIYNYNANNIPNTFEIAYKLKLKLQTSDSVHTYTVNGTELSTEFKEIEGVLPANVKSFNTVTVHVNLKSGNSENQDYSDIIAIAEPSEPLFMRQRLLGAKLSLVLTSGEFTVSGNFVNAEDDITTLAGFQYIITPSGIWNGEGLPYISLSWDPLLLELSKTSKYYTVFDDDTSNDDDDFFEWAIDEETVDGVTYNVLTITAKEGSSFTEVIPLTFFRAVDSTLPVTEELVDGNYVTLKYSGQE